jgi:hypothetical protein
MNMNVSQPNLSLLTTSSDHTLTSDALDVDQIGKIVARSLDKELTHLSPKISQRLENARVLALSQRKIGSPAVAKPSFQFSFIPSLRLISPIFIVLALVFVIAQWQQNARISDIADIDTAILTDSVPPDAYADDGFRLFMKKMIKAAKEEEAQLESKALTDSATVNQDRPAESKNESRAPDISNNQ